MIEPYSKNNITVLWNDPYISRKMLEYNLQTDNDAVSRNINTVTKSVEFITDKYKLGKGSTLCDLGCGAGLYTNLFQQQGIEVTGIDVSTHSIEYAKEQNKKVKYINGNYLNHKPKKTYDFVSMIYCGLSELIESERIKLLSNVKSMLKDNGLFMFDVWNYTFYEEVEKLNEEKYEQDGFYMKGRSKIKINNYKYDDLHLILTRTKIKGHKNISFYVWDKFYNIEEITKLLQDNGLKVVDIYGNTYGGKYIEAEYGLTVVCKKE